MAKFVGMWEGYKGGCKQESESILIDQLISLAREFKLDFHQYVPIIQQPLNLISSFNFYLGATSQVDKLGAI